MSLTQELAAYLERPISDNDRARAALLLLDWTGCAAAGAQEAAGQKLAAAFPDETGHCMRIGAGPSSPLMAALHNGCLGNVLEMDGVDKRAVLHAAPTVIPAALAAAQHSGARGADVLDGIVKGYEATIRLGRAVGAQHYAFWHNTATCGPFGAAAAACHLIKGSDLVSAFGLAGTQAAGLWQTRHEPESMAKQLHAGHAAHAGLLAAMLSVQGFAGPRFILEGPQGFFAAMCKGAEPKDVLADYGDGWLIHQTSVKPYPACRHAHAAIDAAIYMHGSDEFDIDVEAVDEIIIETYKDALTFCDNPHPKTIMEAKFSLQHCVATVLAKGGLEFDDFDPSKFTSAFSSDHSHKIPRLRDKIKVKIDPDIERRYPAQYGAALTIGLNHFETYDALGDPEKPLSRDQITEKAAGLMQYAGMDAKASQSLITSCLGLAQGGDIDDYFKALTRFKARS